MSQIIAEIVFNECSKHRRALINPTPTNIEQGEENMPKGNQGGKQTSGQGGRQGGSQGGKQGDKGSQGGGGRSGGGSQKSGGQGNR
jgi:hypothetical protein